MRRKLIPVCLEGKTCFIYNLFSHELQFKEPSVCFIQHCLSFLFHIDLNWPLSRNITQSSQVSDTGPRLLSCSH